MTKHYWAQSPMATTDRLDALASGERNDGALRQRVLLVAGAAIIWFAISGSLASATPIYTGWSTPVNLGPVVNSSDSELGPALSWDSLSLYISVTKTTGFGSNDIWVSHRATVNDAWGVPVNIGPTINTAATEFVPTFSEDGHRMFFASDRAGGSGGQDIYQSYRSDIHDDFGWQAPTNLGPGLNSSADDNASTYFDNGGNPELIFGSGRLGGAARDLFLGHLQEDGYLGRSHADHRTEQPDDREPADHPSGWTRDLLLLGSSGRVWRHRFVDVNPRDR